MIEIQNDGPKIVASNYWDSQAARDGYVYLSANAGSWRLLVPSDWAGLAEMGESVEGVCITRGSYPRLGFADGVEILFDDKSDAPYCLHISTASIDRLPPGSDREQRSIIIYGPGAVEIARHRCLYRTRSTLPCLDPWRQP